MWRLSDPDWPWCYRVEDQPPPQHERRAAIDGRDRLSVPWSVPGSGRITSTDGAVAHIARLAGTQVSSDGVGADGILVAQILATGALVVLCGGQRETLYELFKFTGGNDWHFPPLVLM